MSDVAESTTVESATATRRSSDVRRRRSWPKPDPAPPFHPAVWLIRLLVVLSEPVRLASRTLLRLLEEPRYVTGRRGVVTVRRSLQEGLWREPLWHPRKRMYGGFASDLPSEVLDLGHAILVDYLGVEPTDRLCTVFAHRAFADLTHRHQRWSLSTLDVERALRLAVMELASEADLIAVPRTQAVA